MKLSAILILISYFQVMASVYAQKISLAVKQQPIEKVFSQIQKQSGYIFFYDENMIKEANAVTLNVKEKNLTETLDLLFEGQPFTYEMVKKTIVVKAKAFVKPRVSASPRQQKITGLVTDEKDEPLGGASVTIKGGTVATITDKDGRYSIEANENDILVFSFLGFMTKEIAVGNRSIMNIKLAESVGQLDQVQVIAYGTTTRRLNTGSVATVSAKDISQQPVSNALATLVGKVPGLVVTQQSGMPGSSFTVQIRGRNSIAQGSQPLILIDGIPFAAGNENIQLIGSAISNAGQQSGVSPFAAINPADIESIEILKDADATAIYGSRGANGVILITTKKGQAGKTQINANINRGFTQVVKLLPLLNTEQYIALRKEAFANAGTTPTTINAPDLTIYNQTRYTDYQKEFLGGTGNTTNANLSLSGGNEATQFLLSGTYYRETNIFPESLPNQRGSVLANINHKSSDNRFSLNFSGNFTSSENRAPTSDLTFYTYLSPNTPAFFDKDGKLQWAYNGVSIENPYAYLREKYQLRTNNLVGSLNASYRLWEGLTAKILMGYNQQFTNEQKLSPSEAKNPNSSSVQGNTAIFGKNQYSSWNIEPQLEYKSKLWIGSLTALVGTTFLSRSNNSLTVEGSGYSSEALLESLDAATTIDASSMNSKYRYQALFGRLNYNIADKYLMNLTGRRDGSSRFGPGKQFANFGAVGAAWIFSSEKWFEKNLSVVSFGKLRGSYGVTGNDQIGDYQFVETWKSPSYTYFGDASLIPNNLFNADYAWERNKKLEGAIDLGFLKDRILFSAGYYQNRSSNQLINYRLPYLTGFSSVIANFPATVENEGWELSITATPVQTKQFRWNSSFNITFPKNTLLSFPGIESSTYQSLYVVGNSLNSIYNYKSLGVNPTTGLLNFYDANGNGVVDIGDYQINGTIDPKFYGGWQNTLSYKGLELQWFFDFKKQTGKNIYYYLYGISLPAGTMRNQPDLLADRWKNTGDLSDLPKVMPSGTGTIASNTVSSSFAYSNQSFIRLRNVSLSYTFNVKTLAKIGAKSARIYLQGQNLLTINRTKGYDPETQNPALMPILQAYTVGLQISY
ncbi:TonB-dependent receptor [Chryseobacterium sp. SIMBA_029]|uniref:TonB-dependent receptor n=2 Tax=Pseudomonadati TaxID=3379134 RepID=UPI00397C6023